MNFKITDKIEEQDRAEIFAKLLEYNLARIEDKKPKELDVYLENTKGQKIAGLIGETHENWLTIKYLRVDKDLRKQQIGSQILEKAEAAAKMRGCRFSF